MNSLKFSLLSVSIISVFQLIDFSTAGNECWDIFLPREFLTGSQVQYNLWPYAASIIDIKKSRLFCGGTLISDKHVLTAAHCLQQKNMELKYAPEDLAVLVGIYGPLLRFDSNVRNIVVSEIFIHPDWTEVNTMRYDADIAILQLSDNVTFSLTILPICIPGYSDVVDSGRGIIVGWNMTEDNPMVSTISFDLVEETLKHSAISVSDLSYCYRSFENVLSSERILCGMIEGKSFISDFSGGGLIMPSHSSWVQYGISITTASSQPVDGNSFIMLTNVKSFKYWIEHIVKQSGGSSVGVAHRDFVDLNCNCGPLYSFSCACLIQNIDVRNENVTAQAPNRRSDSFDRIQLDVDLINFVNGTMVFLIDGIGLVFPVLKSIHIGDAHSAPLGLKYIKRSNFQNMQNLMEIVIHRSDIELVANDIFWDLPNLERFHLEGKIKVLNDRIFGGNSKLREIYLASNRLVFLPRNLFADNSLLNWANFNGNALKIIEIDFTVFKHIQYVFMHNNDCIDADYNRTAEVQAQPIQKLKEFQIEIMNGCSIDQ